MTETVISLTVCSGPRTSSAFVLGVTTPRFRALYLQEGGACLPEKIVASGSEPQTPKGETPTSTEARRGQERRAKRAVITSLRARS